MSAETTETTLKEFCDAAGASVSAVIGRWTDEVGRGTIEVLPPDEPPLLEARVELPALTIAAWYGDQSAGGNVLTLTTRGAKLLAARIVGSQESSDASEEITELELSALDEAMGHIMTAAATAASNLLGREVATGTPQTETVESEDDARRLCSPAEHVCAYSFSVCDEPARLVQVVPAALLAEVREQASREALGADAGASGDIAADHSSEGAIRGVPVRLWAELGRLRMPLARAVGLPPGVVVEFECDADDPVELFVNGRPFATGRLLVGEGRWAVEVIELHEQETRAA